MATIFMPTRYMQKKKRKRRREEKEKEKEKKDIYLNIYNIK